MDHGDGIDGRRIALISNSSKAFFYISNGALAKSRAQREIPASNPHCERKIPLTQIKARHPDGRERARALTTGRVALRDLVFWFRRPTERRP